MRDHDLDFTIARLGECRIQSPMSGVRFTRDEERVLYHATLEGIRTCLDNGAAPPAMESAGPRRTAVLRSGEAGVRDRDVRRSLPRIEQRDPRIVLSLRHHYGVNKVYGFRFGYEGLVRRIGHAAARVDASNPSTGSTRAADRSSGRPEGPRTPRKWWITWRNWESGSSLPSAATGRFAGHRRSARKRRGAA